MEAILKVILFFIALLAIVNGAYIIYMPPEGDAVTGLVIMAVGVLIIIGVIWISRVHDRKLR
jgi:hypothetical protein